VQSPLPAQDLPSKSQEGNGNLDLTSFPGQILEDVVVPVPSEILAVLDKLGDPDWKKEITTITRPTLTDRTELALLLGTTVADGFIAVQAQDQKTIENIGREVLELARALGVKDAVVEHCNAIEKAAKAKKWDAVAKELDATQNTVRQRMARLKDGALAECISVGGWLRGTHAVTSVISKAYTPEQAELLNQPDLAQYFRDHLEEILLKNPDQAKLKLISSGLAQIHEVMSKNPEKITADSVATLHRITQDLVQRIQTKA
jgi:hypothetical protein